MMSYCFFTALVMSSVIGAAEIVDWCPKTDGLMQSSRELILASHNHLRSTLALGTIRSRNGKSLGPAADMKEMTYDCKLEEQALNWAQRCVFEHSKNDGHTYGENLYAFYPGRRYKLKQRKVIMNATTDWWNEHQTRVVFDGNLPVLKEKLFLMGGGHFTQMAWAETDRLGCGYHFCKPQNMALFVCLYQPAGNWLGEMVFSPGAACSRCPESHPICDELDGLCKIK
ncbi:unnamed protein product [Bursaphelenchus xylophilus]|uniref:(pine wood nematode) hypothetical protein n=1 Tax=Bursaphelenchus xylophilus TaxID=6326 RepID=A0A1I7SEW3_BURXY|nr:unnamed protein product [Bursaphelenchus xylophilus]CAG9113242.1 unnamed protein product [Bursaphelenchus xylophilus]